MNKLKPVAWMRKWVFDKEPEFKVLNEKTGRMVIHRKFKYLPVSIHRVFHDDVPLYSANSVEKEGQK